MTTRATLKIAGLAALIAVGGGAGYAQSRTDSTTRGAMFDRIDANGDGQVTAEELQVRAKARFDAEDAAGIEALAAAIAKRI